MMIAALIIAGLVVAGVALGMFAVFSAPVGYQDEKGFHFGTQQPTHASGNLGYEVRHAKAA